MSETPFPALRNSLLVQNRQRKVKVDARRLRWMTRHLLEELLRHESYDLCVSVISDPQMIELNETHLRHAGTTDVITFDYNDPEREGHICGEIFVSVDVALTQARRFRTTWASELTRYVVHGILHLSGYDDLEPDKRRKMKVAENRLLKALDSKFRVSKLASASGAASW